MKILFSWKVGVADLRAMTAITTDFHLFNLFKSLEISLERPLTQNQTFLDHFFKLYLKLYNISQSLLLKYSIYIAAHCVYRVIEISVWRNIEML